MAETLTFELVSPEKLLVSKPVVLVTVPGTEGDFGVLVGHAPMIATLKAGIIDIYTEENAAAKERIFVAGGFAEVSQTRCTVLADEATPVAELDRAKLVHASSDLAAKLANASDAERGALLAEQAILSAKIQAAA
jgi:F-type H+-transporting ATPase subunit epsilon